jgi:hypothetical protein
VGVEPNHTTTEKACSSTKSFNTLWENLKILENHQNVFVPTNIGSGDTVHKNGNLTKLSDKKNQFWKKM